MRTAPDPIGVSVVCAVCARMLDVTEIDGEPVQPYTADHVLAVARALPGWRVVGRRCYCPDQACQAQAVA